ncbi:MAG: hypothetical protein B9J98_01100 [Candidatus Terraquivivens tikiterensis]|uniref:Uncharacterized protein n=1 Tax=Candidatus Terraquivivens tikiterensis TaxID=1980982 RepID=A0A2R7Y9J4_9ARCH|nr:MAG: hypothetical protein B9J98_01100 [Candidatus Terraquivivens tikiterensis]
MGSTPDVKDKLFTVFMITILLLIVWAMFLLVLYLMSVLVIPLSISPHEPLVISVYRIGAALLILAAWIVGWHRLATFWLHRVLKRGGGHDTSGRDDSPG